MKQNEPLRACGIAAEYNPFHNGHQYQALEARRLTGCDVLIAVMSGNFVQRGEPAVIDKWKRSEAAVKNGLDLVVELPYLYAAQSATGFATGAVKMLELAKADWMCFGSECGNLQNLQEIADTPVNPDHLHQSMDSGMSYPRAYSLLTGSMLPNDLLGVCYLKQLAHTSIQPVLVQRTSDYRDETIHPSASALAIRKALKQNQNLQNTTVMEPILKSSELAWPELYYPYIRTLLLTSDPDRLKDLFLFSEGIENHLIRNAKKESTYEGFLNACTNYRYTAGRIRRCLLSLANQVTKQEVQALPAADTLRILAFNDRGRAYLRQLKNTDVRVASRFADVPYPWRKLEYRTSLFYTSVFSEKTRVEILEKEIGGARYIPE